jgi:glycosyltransferase involved in cell wall biosynthesis
MTSPLISCIVPVFNGERYLGEALDSILAQTYRPLEVIVVDDGSTDGTAALAETYRDRVRYAYQPEAGPPATRNQGVRLARGEYVAFLDADDLWHPEKLARQVALLQARPELACCLTHVQPFWIAELAEEAARLRDHPRNRAVPGYAASSLLARRGVFETVGYFDPEQWYGDIIDWFARIAEHGLQMEMLPDILVYRRFHHMNLTRRRNAEYRREFPRLMKALLDRRRAGSGGRSGLLALN